MLSTIRDQRPPPNQYIAGKEMKEAERLLFVLGGVNDR